MERYFGHWYKNLEARPPCGGYYIVVLCSNEYGVKPVMDVRGYNQSTNEWQKTASDIRLKYNVKYWTHFPSMPQELDIISPDA